MCITKDLDLEDDLHLAPAARLWLQGAEGGAEGSAEGGAEGGVEGEGGAEGWSCTTKEFLSK